MNFKYFAAAAACLAATLAHADSKVMKPGLWEITIQGTSMDGQDMSGQMKAAQEQMKAALDKMSPEQKAQMEKMMGGMGMKPPAASPNGGMQVCISPEMAARDRPVLDPHEHCEMLNYNRSGSKATFEMSCKRDGNEIHGKGESTLADGLITSKSDMTVTDKRGTHQMHSESQMKFVGADCQGVKPLEELAKDMKGAAKQ